MIKKRLSYSIKSVSPYINWAYFYHAWSMTGKPNEEKQKLRDDAEERLENFDRKYHTFALFGIFEANSDGDDLVIEQNVRIPLLRQQKPTKQGEPNLCLSDFVRPLSSGIPDKVGMFATTVESLLATENQGDAYEQMMAQVLADRLAEATAEKMHQEVRMDYWGYAPDENLTMEELHQEHYQGIRPAIGYPSLPDTSVNFILSELLGMKEIGIRLTESGMMVPHASVSGFMFAHPKAHYFDLGKIGEDQLRDYAKRRGIPLELMRKFLVSSLLKR
ncbi:MAG: 5-methyltetrahydrofolate--homocysteine methyltransferase [Prevotella sp.]|jgi:cobalamin-dependent methionine synthase I|nr:5-methyltetrahydrofolate--homocysteine methyltransferase [Prevotella sp.]MCI1281205.1 5-methyltetrahydrofolate--homocysteine methyltransferase [Prevotella sp.]